MTFDLRIQFSGLVMYVPEGESRMHVLLPACTPGPAGENERIPGARIVYDVVYEQPSQTQLSRQYKTVDLTGRVLDLTSLSTAEGFCGCLPDELPSLNGIADPVPADLLHDLPNHRLTGRVTMDAGVLSIYDVGAVFQFGNKDQGQRTTSQTEWTIRGITSRTAKGGQPYLPGTTLPGGIGLPEQRLPDLFPIGQTIHLAVIHMDGSSTGGDLPNLSSAVRHSILAPDPAGDTNPLA